MSVPSFWSDERIVCSAFALIGNLSMIDCALFNWLDEKSVSTTTNASASAGATRRRRPTTTRRLRRPPQPAARTATPRARRT